MPGVGRATIEAYDEKPYLKLIIERQAFIESVINLLRHGIKDYRSISGLRIEPKKQISKLDKMTSKERKLSGCQNTNLVYSLFFSRI